jgi:hypothetical protein
MLYYQIQTFLDYNSIKLTMFEKRAFIPFHIICQILYIWNKYFTTGIMTPSSDSMCFFNSFHDYYFCWQGGGFCGP